MVQTEFDFMYDTSSEIQDAQHPETAHAYLILGPVPGGVAVRRPLQMTKLNFVTCIHRANIKWKFNLKKLTILVPVNLNSRKKETFT